MAIGLKICGVTNADDLRACRDAGVTAVGLNLWAGSKRHVATDDAARILDEVRREGPLPTIVGVFVDPDLESLRAAITRLDLDAIQLHGDAAPDPYAALGQPWIRVIRGPSAAATPRVDLVEVRPVVPPPMWVLLDAAVAGYGGQRTRVDWAWAAIAVARLAPHDVWLAGGIDPECAARAIASVCPAGLDVASGVEIAGDPRKKDRAKIAALATICQKVQP